MKRRSLVGMLVLGVAISSCTREQPPPERGPASPTPLPAEAVSVSGSVRFAGEPPEPTKIRMTGDCAGEVSSVDVRIRDGLVENAFVYVREGLEGRVFERPTPPVVVDQVGCVYEPHVVGVQSGQELVFKNSDPTLHNVHTVPEKNRAVNFGLGVKGAQRSIRINEPEVMVTVKCDVHPWMRAYVGVLDHPYFAVTGQDGSFRFENLPPGEYVVESWHERLGRRSARVELSEGASAEIVFEYE